MTDEVSSTSREHETYITLDTFRSDKGDPGGFGFGGASGMTGGFGVGGAGPHPGLEPHRQAHYGQRVAPSAPNSPPISFSRPRTADAKHGASEDYPSWLDGFPHSFHGWGPNAPDYHPQHDAVTAPAPTETIPRIGFLEMTVMKGADPFATGLIWQERK